MKRRNFLIALCAMFLLSTNAWSAEVGDDNIWCGGQTFTYNDDGSVTVTWDGWDEGTTYDSLDDLYESLYGDAPRNLEGSDLALMFGITLPQNSSNNNTSVKHRGRLIYTVQEATEVAKEGSVNRFRLRYK